ncbi:MAG: EF-P lysine aminoacylase EpmA [Halieaceae bacterium]|jgi:lysyl-tRNA synthetase class 2|nr:EF-P lysine aminoacylase EpmA [Halieaceae bacterium]
MIEHWRPSASLEALRARAALLAQVRQFFQTRGVLEVETPLLCQYTVTDPNLTPVASGTRWLQTSPEYAMKRLLAAGSGPIYQVCKAFRAGEAGPRHNPEFTLLEWYRPDFDLTALMDETADLVSAVLGERPRETLSYRDLFLRYLDIDPLTAPTEDLARLARAHVDYGGADEARDTWLDLLMSHVLEPRLQGISLVHSYPRSQAALAVVEDADGQPVARRFELYVDGMELANGYLELTDATEQRARFERDNAALQAAGEPPRALDEALLAALEAGLPACAGVALGLDRLLALKLGESSLARVLSFDWSRC